MNEGQLHIQRTKLISSDALREHALRLELYKCVANGNVPASELDAIKADDEEHLLSNKTLADIVKSTMGAALQTSPTITTIIIGTMSVTSQNSGSNRTPALAEALVTNSTLTTLNLESNWIDSNGALALAEALMTNSTLI
ncbi:hypothetical protein BG000_005996, partial [Podila horticola]